MTNDWPDWQDAGRNVRLQFNDREVIGSLYVEDVGFTGEDEYPIFVVATEAGEKVDFASADNWRFV